MKVDSTNKQAFGMKFTLIGPNAAIHAKRIVNGFAEEYTMAAPFFCEKEGMVHVASGKDFFELQKIRNDIGFENNPLKIISAFFKDAIEIMIHN